jgi:1-acyl-sn-glycerol-3-phosphate acyltransferase
VFNRFIQLTLGTWLERNFCSAAENRELFDTVKPPYFLMSTHNCVFDPFIIADFVPEPISYLVSDAAFRKPFMGWALGLVGSIPKTKAVSDLGAIKNIMNIKKKGGVIGVFPEGQSPWDGHSFPIIYSTAKLLKLMKIPVVAAHKQGAYFSMPRWAKSRRKGKVTIRFELGFTPEEIKESSPDDIYRKLTKLFEHDEYELQRRDMIRYTGKDRAEYLEIALFICPECRKIGTMNSEGDDFFCSSCGYKVFYNEYCFFERQDGNLHFDSIRDWNKWQEEYLTGYLSTGDGDSKQAPLFQDEEIDLQTGYKTDPMVKAGRGILQLYRDRIIFRPEGTTEELTFPMAEIEGINVHEDEKLEFYHMNTLYRFDSENKRISMYKWYLCVRNLQK